MKKQYNFTHIYESFITGSSDATITENISIAMMKRLFELAPIIKEDPYNISVREEISYISMMALSGIPDNGLSGVYPLHDLAAQVSVQLKISHASSLGILFKETALFIRNSKMVEMKFEFIVNS